MIILSSRGNRAAKIDFRCLCLREGGVDPGLLNGQCFQLCGALLLGFEVLVRNRRGLVMP
jgi:hypothetical protein